MVHCTTTVYCLFHFVAVVVIVPVPITFSLSRITYSHLHEHTYETEAVNLTRTHACVLVWVYSWLLCSIALRGNCVCECKCVYDDVVVWFANTTYLAVYLFCVVMLTFFSPCIIPRFFSTVRHCYSARTYTRQRAIIVSSYLVYPFHYFSAVTTIVWNDICILNGVLTRSLATNIPSFPPHAHDEKI